MMLADVVFLQDATPAVGVLYELWRQADIQYLEPAQMYCWLSASIIDKLLLLQGQREVGTDDVGMDVIGVVLAHQTGRQVDTYHLGCTLVDVFHHGSKTSG